MKKLLLLLNSFLMLGSAFPQWKGGIEQYKYINHSQGAFVPIIHLQSAGNWYAELRYNYDEHDAYSLNIGRSFKLKQLEYTITPMVGIVSGSVNGFNFGLNQQVEAKGFFFSSQSQFTRLSGQEHTNFFYTWAEAGYQIADNFFAGVSWQGTKLVKGEFISDEGVMAGFEIGNWSFPVYVFELFKGNTFVLAGINYTWQFGSKRSRK